MAIKKVEYEISVNSDDAIRGTKDLSDATFRLRDAVGRFATPAQVEFFKQLQKTRQELDNQAKSGKSLSKEYEELEKQTDLLNSSLGGTLTQVNQTASAFEKISNSISSITSSINSAIDLFSNLVLMMDKLTDPVFVKKLSTIAFVVGRIAGLKGYDNISKSALSAAESVDKYNDFILENELSTDKMIEKIEAAEKAFKAYDMAIDIGKASLISYAAATITTSSKNTNLIQSSVAAFKNFSSAGDTSFSSVGSLLKDLGGIFATTLKDIPRSAVTTAVSSFDFLKNTMSSLSKEGLNLTSILSKTHVGGSLIAVSELASLSGTAFTSLGLVLATADSGFLKFTGTILLVIGLLSGGLALIINKLLGMIGQLAYSIGVSMAEAMNSFESAANKAEVSLVNFNYTMKGFNNTFGDGIGTAEEWNKVIKDISDSTIITSVDARRMVTEVVQVGTALGMSKEQMMELTKVIPNYVKAGDDAFDVTVSFLQAINGMGQGVIKYGIHVSEAAVEHSKLFKSLGLSLDTMTESEKAAARFATILEQSSPVVGRASEQLKTIAGSQIKLQNAIKDTQAVLGEQNYLIRLLYSGLTKLLTSVALIPKPILEIVGSLWDFVSVSLIAIGTILKILIPLASVTLAYKVFTSIVNTSSMAQTVATVVTSKLSGALGVQAVAVTSSSSLFLALSRILTGIVTVSISSIISLLGTLAAQIKILTLSILSNPLFWKAAAIATAIYLVVKAFQQLYDQITVLTTNTRSYNEAAENTLGIGALLYQSFQSISNIIGKVIGKLVDFTSILVGTLLKGTNAILLLLNYLAKLLTFSNVFKNNAVSETLNSWEDSLLEFGDSLNKVTSAAANNMLSFADVAQGLITSQVMENIKNNLIRAKKELVSDLEKQKISAEVFGAPIQSLQLSKSLAEQNILTEKELSTRKQLAQELIRTEYQIAKALQDASKMGSDALTGVKEAEAQRTAGIAGIVKLSRIKLQKDLEPLLKELDNLAFTPNTQDAIEARKKLDEAIIAIERENFAKRKEDIQKFNEEANAKKSEALLEVKKLTGTETQIILAEAQKRKDELKKQYSKILDSKQMAVVLSAIDKEATDKILKNRIELQNTIDSNSLESAKINAEMAYEQGKISTEEFYKMQENAQLAAIQKEYDSYVASLSDKKLAEDEFRKAQDSAFKLMLDKKKQAEIKNQKDILEEQRKNQTDADKLLGTGTKTFEIEYQKRLEKIQELQGTGAMSPEQAGRAEQLAGVEKGAQEPFVKMGDMAANSFLGPVASGIQGLQAGMSSMMGGVVGVIAKIPEFISGAIDMVDGLMNSWMDLPTKIFDKFVASNEKLMEFPGKFLSTIGDNLPRISEYFSKSIVDTGPRLITSVLKGVPRLIAGLIKSIPAVIRGFINGFVDGIMNLGQTIKDIFAGNFDFSGVTEAGTKAVDAVGKSVTGVGEQLFGYVEASGAQQAQGNAKAITEATTKSAGVFEKLWARLTAIWDGFYNKFKPLIDAVIAYFKSYFEVVGAFVGIVIDMILPTINFLIDGIVSSFTFLGIILESAWNLAKWLFVDIVWGLVLKPFIDLTKWLFVDIVWGLVLKPAWEALKAIWDFVTGIFDDPIQAFKDLWTDFKDIFSGIGESLGKAGDDLLKIFDDFSASITKAFTDAWADFTALGTKVGEWFSDGLKSFKTFFSEIGTIIWDGIKSAWGSVKNFFSSLFTFEPSQGSVEKWIGIDIPWVNFAEGGIVGGNAKVAGDSLKNDTVPALLSPGEYVLPRSVTQDKNLMKMLAAIINSKEKVQMKAKGDPWYKQVGSAISSAASTVWEGAKAVGDFIIPDWAQELFNSISRFASNLSIKDLIADPKGYLNNKVKEFMSVILQDPVKSLFQQAGSLFMANGGLVPQGTDTVPAMLTPGEYVINREAVSRLGSGFLDRLNSGSTGASASVTNNIELTLNIRTEQPIDERFVKQTLMPTIRDELRRNSLDGKRMLASSGVR